MNNLMEYRGYHARVEFSEEDGCFVGTVLGIADTVAFDGESVEELKASFRDCIEEYLKFCQQMGRQPGKEFKGSFNVRVGQALHREAAICAAQRGESLNSFVTEALRQAIRATGR